MRRSKFIFLALLMVGFYSCHDSLEPSGCIGDKMEEFKQYSWAESIVKINKPGETLYWFVDTGADTGESVLNERCELVCITDCECTGNFVQCDWIQLDYPKETIWHK